MDTGGWPTACAGHSKPNAVKLRNIKDTRTQSLFQSIILINLAQVLRRIKNFFTWHFLKESDFRLENKISPFP